MFRWVLDTIVNDSQEPQIETVKPRRGTNFRIVQKGFFHACSSMKSASAHAELYRIDRKDFLLRHPKYSVVIKEAVIPEGTKYYEGTNGDICAKSLKILNKDVPILETENTTGG